MKRPKPVIGIAPRIDMNLRKREVIGNYRTYIRAVERAGALPVILHPEPKRAKDYALCCDGLLLTGGGDIHPRFFGARIGKGKLRLSPTERTVFELSLIRPFLKERKPILAICLGAQTLNVALGGTLIQDLPTECPEVRDHTKGMHDVAVKNGSLLAEILGKTKARVNSHHHQAISRPGNGIRVVAKSSDGVIEAVEVKGFPFVLGVQWHPETSMDRIESKRIFKAFVRACARGRQS
jgi:putative glutamine amidotransferase